MSSARLVSVLAPLLFLLLSMGGALLVLHRERRRLAPVRAASKRTRPSRP